MIDVQLRRDARGAQLREIANSLGVERLAVADERIGGRQAGKVRQPRGRGIGRQVRTVSAAQVEPPGEMVAPGVPAAAMVVAGGLGVAVVQHGVERHLEGDIHRPLVPGADADGGTQAAARALAADHELVAPHAERRGMAAQVQKRRIAVVHGCGIRRLQRQPVARRQHHCAESLHQLHGAGHMDHFLHPGGVAAAVEPEDTGRVLRRGFRRENEGRDAALRGRNAEAADADGRVRPHGSHGAPPFCF